MIRQKYWALFPALLTLLLLSLDGSVARHFAFEGLEICLKTVIPSLFPFIFLTNYIISQLHSAEPCSLKTIGRLFHMPEGTSGLLIPAFLGGYPAGAQNIGCLFHQGYLSKENAEKLLCFCSNAGPAFLFGMVSSQFSNARIPWLCWGIQIIGAWAASLPIRYEKTSIFPQTPSAPDLMGGTVTAMGKICGWIILFRILIGYCESFLGSLTPSVKTLLIGALELTNGCCLLSEISSSEMRFLVANIILSFGGCCVLLQTLSVANGLSLRYYLLGKCIQLLCSVVLSVPLFRHPQFILPMILTISLSLFVKKQKHYGNPKKVSV